MTIDKINWKPNFTFSSVPNFIMNEIKTIANFIEFTDSNSDDFVAFKTNKYNFCEGASAQKYAITKQKSIMSNAIDKTILSKINGCNFNKCIYCLGGDRKVCPESWTLPTGKCPVMLAAYYKYLQEYNPDEYKNQRKAYFANKDAVDGTILNGFKFFSPYGELPLMSSNLLKEIREQIDRGNFELRESKCVSFYLYDIDKNEACSENRWFKGCSFDKAGPNVIVNYLSACQDHSFDWLDNKFQERIYLILFVLKLLHMGIYEDYKKRILEKEKKIKKLKGLGYYGYIAGNDNNEMKKVIDEKTFQIRYSFDIPRLGYEQVSALELAQSIAETDGNNVHNPITYKPLSGDKIYVVTDLDEFCNCYKEKDAFGLTERQLTHFLKQLYSLDVNKYILLTGTSQEIKNFMKINKSIEFLYGRNGTNIKDLSDKDIFKQFCSLVPNKIKMPEDAEKQFINYMSVNRCAFPYNNSSLAKFLADYVISSGRFVLPYSFSDIKRREFMDHINKLIGLKDLKEQMINLYNLASFKKIIQKHGCQLDSTNMHMIFEGNPGTGKTTSARLIAAALYNIGIIKENKVIECERKDLVAGYVGQTAIKTYEKIQEALGGILFIDEAYSLCHSDKKDFGNEAIATLVKAMEDHKEDLVVIYAGYSKEMEDFVASNPGIKSRIGFYFHFPDYNEQELCEMYIDKISNAGFNIEEGCTEKCQQVIKSFIHEPNFGNGRFVERIFQTTLQNKANRFAKESKKDFSSIIPTDIPDVLQIKKLYPGENKMKSIGFVSG